VIPLLPSLVSNFCLMRSVTDGIACPYERKDSLLHVAAWSSIHQDVCFWIACALTRLRGWERSRVVVHPLFLYPRCHDPRMCGSLLRGCTNALWRGDGARHPRPALGTPGWCHRRRPAGVSAEGCVCRRAGARPSACCTWSTEGLIIWQLLIIHFGREPEAMT